MGDRRFLLWVCGAALGLAAIPWLLGQALTPPGGQFFGNSPVNIWDPGVYYSYIQQGRTGSPFMADLMTSEPYAATLFQPFWWGLGRLAEWFGLTNPLIFFIARLIGVPVLVGAVWWAGRWLFRDTVTRRLATIVAMFSSGFGGWLSYFHSEFSWRRFPDLWVLELSPLMNLLASPHFLFITAGLIVTLVGVERAWQERSRTLFWVAAGTAVVTLSLHPFHLITWTIFWSGLTIIRSLRARAMQWRYLQTWLGVLGVSGPVILMHGLQWLFDPLVIGRAIQNINYTWAWPHTLVAVGLVGLLAIYSAWRYRHQPEVMWLMMLALAYVIAINLPITFQRRLSHGLLLPFAWLAAVGLAAWWKRWLAWRGHWMLAALMIIFLSGTYVRDLQEFAVVYAHESQVSSGRGSYMNADERGLVRWLLEHPQPQQTVLAALVTSHYIAGLSGQRVFIAHSVETIDWAAKEPQLRNFYGSWSPNQQAVFLTEQQVCYVVDGPRERGYGQAFQPARDPRYTVVWSSPTISLYYWNECVTIRNFSSR